MENEKAKELEKQVDFEKRSKAFGEELDILIEKHGVGLILAGKLVNIRQEGSNLLFDRMETSVQRIDVKRMKEDQEAAAKAAEAAGAGKEKAHGKKGKKQQ